MPDEMANPYGPIKPIPGKGLVFLNAPDIDGRVQRTKADTGNAYADWLVDFVRKGDTTLDTLKAKATAGAVWQMLYKGPTGAVGFIGGIVGKGVIEKPARVVLGPGDTSSIDDIILDILSPFSHFNNSTAEERAREQAMLQGLERFDVGGVPSAAFFGPGGGVAGPIKDFQGLTADEAMKLRGLLGYPVSRRALTDDDVENMTVQAKERVIELMDKSRVSRSARQQAIYDRIKGNLIGFYSAQALIAQATNKQAGFVTNIPMKFRDP